MSGNALALVRAGAPDVLSKSIEYSLKETASYIRARRGVKITPLGGASYNPVQGTRLLRFTISDARAFLDPSTVALTFRLRNMADPNGAGGQRKMRLRGPPQVLFQRARMSIKGTTIEDLQEVPYLCTLLRYCDTKERQTNDSIFNYWDENTGEANPNARANVGIPPGEGRRIMCDLRFFGLFRSNDKYIPLLHAPLVIELWLADGADAFYPPSPAVGGDAAQPAIARSQTYQLEDVFVKCDLLDLSPELISRYENLLDQGNNFPIAFTSFATTRHIVFQTPDQDIQTTRSLALLKTMFLTFSLNDQATINNIGGVGSGIGLAPWNLMLNPRWTVADERTDTRDNFQWQIHIGGNQWPQNPVEGTGAESWYQLRSALDLSTWGFNSFDPAGWRSTRWIAAIDTEKGASSLDNLSFTGVATRSGEPVTFRLKNMRDGAEEPMPTLAFLTLAHDAFVTISRAGCDINY